MPQILPVFVISLGDYDYAVASIFQWYKFSFLTLGPNEMRWLKNI
jgi:hypothetical protein